MDEDAMPVNSLISTSKSTYSRNSLPSLTRLTEDRERSEAIPRKGGL